MTEKTITIVVTDEMTQVETELRFDVSMLDYNNYVNSMNQGDKVAPTNNFLMTCIHEDDKATLKEYLAQGLGMDLAGDVITAFKPKVRTAVKKP